jgi:hypothetical protein
MDGCRLDYCARRLDYCHCRIRPLGRASDFLTASRVSSQTGPRSERLMQRELESDSSKGTDRSLSSCNLPLRQYEKSNGKAQKSSRGTGVRD